jgi:hypothetical protein
MNPRKCAQNTRGRPFEPGNAGKPKGARHKATVATEALLDGEAEALTRKAVEMALAGDTTALRLCLERLLPPRRDRPVVFALGDLASPADALAAVVSVIRAAAGGEITPSEATAITAVLESYRKAYEVTEIEARLAALEGRK